MVPPAVSTSLPPTPDVESTIRSRTLTAALPCSPHAVTYSTIGDGSVCACCDQPLRHGSTQFNVDGSDGKVVSMHRQCFYDWHAIATELESGGA
jgi:hypothetical protein